MPNTVRLHRVLAAKPEKVSRIHRGGCASEVAASQRLCMHRALT
jgi:hypothetical protein